VDKATVQAFDMTPAQMEDAVKTYFKTLSELGIALDQSKKPIADPVDMQQPDHFALPFAADDLGVAVTSVKDEEARAVLDDAMRASGASEQALRDLQQLAADPKDNEAAHRGLARDDIHQKKFDAAPANWRRRRI